MVSNKFLYISYIFILLMIPFSNFSRFGLKFSKCADPNSSGTNLVGVKISDIKFSSRDRDNNGFVKGFVKVRIYGNLHKFAFHYIYIGIGNPKVKQMLIIDTGSQQINVACGRSPGCGKHLLDNYNYQNSLTYKPVDCNSESCKIMEGRCDLQKSCIFKETYSEGSSVNGMYVGDLVSFDINEDSTDLSSFFDYIGCVTTESKLIKSQITNGILGLSRSDKSTLIDNEYYESQSFIEKYLTDHFSPRHKIFSLCFAEDGGMLTLGGYDKELDLLVKKQSNLVWTPMMKSEFYILRVFKFSVDDDIYEVKHKNFVLDTGTTMSTFEKDLFDKIEKPIKQVCYDNKKFSKARKTNVVCKVDEKTGKICFSDLSKLPIITINFEKRTLNDYAWWCLGIEESKTHENILGATFFKNNHIEFHMATAPITGTWTTRKRINLLGVIENTFNF
ncbi:Eukaryotic aspartyl protease family protein [Theileria parva strain Muguga]|uniref:Aspartyl protease, putative n=1 Tax=Theileria parva TaxID=5875 RepID=Q4MZ15_THEPA|nr:Eukaryotic aspartyl protease family protein [Theileria parva strain Muguga]EAN30517.1 Eukaryotic aspartyl protease family protein [Theileria parva strain Muguga]|eukprot:XP_762800.1 aspartyl protease [Theileria parva strain Muguga]